MTTAYLPSREVLRDESRDASDLRETLQVLLRYRAIILAATLIGGATAVTVALTTTRTYSADAALLVSRSKIGELAPSAETLSTANFRPLIENRDVAARVIRDNHLDAAPYWASPTTFFADVVTIDEVRNATILTISGRLNDPALVAKVVNEVASVGVETARRVSQEEAMQARNDIKVQVDEAKLRLDAAESTLQRARSTFQVELLERDVDSALDERSKYLALLISIETERARLAKAEDELGRHKPIDTVHKTIDTDPAMLEAARAAQPASGVLGLQLKSEEKNSVYEEIDKQVAASRTELAGLERQKAQMIARNLDRPQFQELSNLYARQTAVDRLEMERDLAKRVYEQVATSYESARLMVASRSSALQVISRALPPDRPEPRKVVRGLLLGLFTGLVLSSAAVILRASQSRRGPGRGA
jgi:uncharacterized protein involved in exopolysaccharide biosynthesis